MKYIWLGIVTGSVLLFGAQATAGVAEVTFKNSDKFRDIRVSEGTQKRFEEQTLDRLANHFQELAASLPEDQSLVVEITDLDLAGRIDPQAGPTGQRYRVIKHGGVPRIEFNYELKSGTGEVLASDKVSLKDMDFDSSIRRGNQRNEALFYEKAMLSDWFRSESGFVANNN